MVSPGGSKGGWSGIRKGNTHSKIQGLRRGIKHNKVSPGNAENNGSFYRKFSTFTKNNWETIKHTFQVPLKGKKQGENQWDNIMAQLHGNKGVIRDRKKMSNRSAGNGLLRQSHLAANSSVDEHSDITGIDITTDAMIMAGGGIPDKADDSASVQSRLIRHVSDFIAHSDVPETPKSFMQNGVLLFADVSGFTALTEKYSNHSEGTSGLTNALNGYISSICQYILDSGGDILKFAGDAILAIWEVKDRKDMPEAIANVTNCSLQIQTKQDYKMTSVGVELRVKIAISAGKIYCTHVGIPGQIRHIAMSGNPIGEVNAAEKHCQPNDVVISPNAWDICRRENFKGFEVGDGHHRFFKVKYLTQKKFNRWPSIRMYDMESTIDMDSTQAQLTRDACRYKQNDHLETYIRRYISTTVQAKLDDNQPLEYLSEIRQCTILFINLIFDLKEQRRDYTDKLGKTLQAAYEIVDDELRLFGGQLNKLFMFDKGCTFLAVFGLPGLKNEREAAFACQCAFQMSNRMTNEIMELVKVSIGVTTGPIYCGVVGHEERHEYSVLGPKVNMAARIMMAGYPGMVNCDSLTMKCSDLSRDYFLPQGHKNLKGIKTPGIIYQYRETTLPLQSYLRQIFHTEYPILGRVFEIDRIMAETTGSDERCFVIMEGAKGIGKTRILEEIAILSQNINPNIHVVFAAASYDIMNDQFKMIRIIIEELLGIIDLSDRSPGSDAHQEILAALGNSPYKGKADLLNPIFGTLFKGSGTEVRIQNQDDVTARDQNTQHELLYGMIDACLANFDRVVVCIDNGQFIDECSWALLETFACDERAALIVAKRPFTSTPDVQITTIINNPENMHLKLFALQDEYFPALACQMLDVTQMSETLAAALIYRSYGCPGWMEQLLKKMREDKVFTVQDSGKADEKMHIPPRELVLRKVRKKGGEDGMTVGIVAGDRGGPTRRTVSTLANNLRSNSNQTRSNPVGSRSSRQSVGRMGETLAQSISITKGFAHPAMMIDTEGELPADNEDAAKGPRPPNRGNTIRGKTKIGQTNAQYTNILGKISKFYDQDLINRVGFNQTQESECALLEENRNLPDLIDKIQAPQVIRSYIVEQMDRLTPFTQYVCKCAAIVGEYFSRYIVYHMAEGSKKRVDKGFQELMSANIIQCMNQTTENICDCEGAQKSSRFCRTESAIGRLNVRSGYQCDQLKFINSFYYEVIRSLWLKDQSENLHKISANYFESVIDEIRQSRDIAERTLIEFAVNKKCSDEEVLRQKSICSILKINIYDFERRKVFFDRRKMKTNLKMDNSGMPTQHAKQDIKTAASLPNVTEQLTTASKETSAKSKTRKLKKKPAPEISNFVRNEAEDLKLFTSMERFESSRGNVCGIWPSEAQHFLATLIPQIAKHFRESRDTARTIETLLDASEALLNIGKIKEALSNLFEARNIMEDLRLGYDPVRDEREGAEDFMNLDDEIHVYQVPMETRAKHQMLHGDANILTGDPNIARDCYELALRFLGDQVNFKNFFIKRFQIMSLNKKNGKFGAKKIPEHDLIFHGNDSWHLQKAHIWSRIWYHETCKIDNISTTNLQLISLKLSYLAREYCDNRLMIEADIKAIEMVQYNMEAKGGGDLSKTLRKHEQHGLDRCNSINVIRHEDIYVCHKLINQIILTRMSIGDLSSAISMTKNITKASPKGNLGDHNLINLALLAELYLLTCHNKQIVEIVSNMKAELAKQLIQNVELECWTELIITNLALDNGYVTSAPVDLIKWSFPITPSSLSGLQLMCLGTSVALYNIRMGQFDSSFHWLSLAMTHMVECPLSYYYARAYARLVECHIWLLRNSISQMSMPHNAISVPKQSINVTTRDLIREFKKMCSKIPILYPYYYLYKGHYIRLTKPSSTEKDDYLRTGLVSAQILGNKQAELVIQANIAFYIDKETNKNGAVSEVSENGWMCNCMKHICHPEKTYYTKNESVPIVLPSLVTFPSIVDRPQTERKLTIDHRFISSAFLTVAELVNTDVAAAGLVLTFDPQGDFLANSTVISTLEKEVLEVNQ